MLEVNFDEVVEQILAKDARFHRDAYSFMREALGFTQKLIGKENLGKIRHVSGQELLDGVRQYALQQYGPMTFTVLEEWGVRSCRDFGDIVFNMVENGGAHTFAVGDIKDPQSFAAKLRKQPDLLSQFLWTQFPEATRAAMLGVAESETLEPVLVESLNRILLNEGLYRADRFAGVELSEQTKSLLGLDLHGNHIARRNRLLLEDAYPRDIVKSGGLLAKTDKDSREDFAAGYDFYEAFRKPFLPASKQGTPGNSVAGLPRT